MSEIKAGDIVQLKSGGPRMTVEGPEYLVADVESDKVRCVWLDEKGKQQQGLFYPAALKKVEE